MKKIFLLMFAMICSVSLLTFTSCSDDDDPTIDGAYSGALDISSGGSSLAKGVKQKIYITKVNDNAIKLELRDFEFTGIKLGTIAIQKCTTTQQNGASCKFTGNEELTLPTVGKCTVDVTGTIANGQTLDAVINVDVPENKPTPAMKVVVTFKGTK